MAPKLSIINDALIRIGDNPLTSLTENVPAQVIANSQWDIARRALLAEHPWNFALIDQLLAAPIDTIEVDVGSILYAQGYQAPRYKYSFQVPADCLRLWLVYNNRDYQVQGTRILTNERYCRIRYVKDIDDSTIFSADFDDLLAQRLAAQFAYPITKSQASADSLMTIYQQKLKSAKAKDSLLEPMGTLAFDTFIDVRY